MLPKNCALQNCILAGVQVSGRTKCAAWLSDEKGKTASVQPGCMDYCSLMFISIFMAVQICSQDLTVILKINGPSLNNWFSGISIAIIQWCEGVSSALFYFHKSLATF